MSPIQIIGIVAVSIATVLSLITLGIILSSFKKTKELNRTSIILGISSLGVWMFIGILALTLLLINLSSNPSTGSNDQISEVNEDNNGENAIMAALIAIEKEEKQERDKIYEKLKGLMSETDSKKELIANGNEIQGYLRELTLFKDEYKDVTEFQKQFDDMMAKYKVTVTKLADSNKSARNKASVENASSTSKGQPTFTTKRPPVKNVKPLSDKEIAELRRKFEQAINLDVTASQYIFNGEKQKAIKTLNQAIRIYKSLEKYKSYLLKFDAEYQNAKNRLIEARTGKVKVTDYYGEEPTDKARKDEGWTEDDLDHSVDHIDPHSDVIEKPKTDTAKAVAESRSIKVWISDQDDDYHSDPNCRFFNPGRFKQHITEKEADEQGYQRCSYCLAP